MSTLAVTHIEQVSVTISPDALTIRDSAITDARAIVLIADDFTLECAAESFVALNKILRAVESERKLVKAPVLNLGTDIDTKAKDFVAPVKTESERLDGMITSYRDKKRREAEELERQRQAELARIEKEKADAAESEQKRIADAAKAEADRKKAEEQAQCAFTPQELNDAQAKAKAAEAEQLRLDQEAQTGRQRTAELERQRQLTQRAVVIPPAKIAGLTETKVWRFEVTDLEILTRQNFKLVRVEPNTAAITIAIADGCRDIPGLRIWQETKTQAR